jgi:hypothetical protein
LATQSSKHPKKCAYISGIRQSNKESKMNNKNLSGLGNVFSHLKL